MSDQFDRLRAANPVPAPRVFGSETRRRMIAAIVAHEPEGEGGPFARLLSQLLRRRLYVIVVAAVLAAGCTAGAVAVLHGERSAPLSGALPGPPGGKYSFNVIPSLGAGTVGWCISEETQTRPPSLRTLASKLRSNLEQALTRFQAELLGGHLSAARRRQLTGFVHHVIPGYLRSLTPARYRSSPLLREFARLAAAGEGGTGLCAVAGALNRPIIDAMTAGSSAHLVGLYLTAPDVAAVRISRRVTVLTAASSQLPDGDRYAVVVEPNGKSGPAGGSGPWPVVALNRGGRAIPARLVPTGAEWTVSWQARRGQSIPTPSVTRRTPPPAACELDARALSGAKLYYGAVVVHVRAQPRLQGRPYVSCAYIQLNYRGYTVQAAILVDARDPGQLPAALPDAVAVRSQPDTVNEQQRVFSGQPPITARRIGDAWLAVETLSRQGRTTLSERLAVLDKLAACVRLQGRLCP